jgi:hypothetical protein
VFLFAMFARCRTQESDLYPVTPTPFAEHQVNPQTQALAERELRIQSGGLKLDGLFAAGRKIADPSTEGFQDISEPIHQGRCTVLRQMRYCFEFVAGTFGSLQRFFNCLWRPECAGGYAAGRPVTTRAAEKRQNVHRGPAPSDAETGVVSGNACTSSTSGNAGAS